VGGERSHHCAIPTPQNNYSSGVFIEEEFINCT